MKFFNFQVFKIENRFSENVKIDRKKSIIVKNRKNRFYMSVLSKKSKNDLKSESLFSFLLWFNENE